MTHIKITDKNAAREIRKRNAGALEYIMEIYTKSVYILVSKIAGGFGSIEDVEECVSDVFTYVWKNIDKYDETKGGLKTWILIIAKYRALDYKRKLAKASTEEIQENMACGVDVESNVVLKDQIREVVEVVKEFDETDRKIFLKRYFYYESVESIADNMKLTKCAVYKRLWRSRNLLKDTLQRRGVIFDG